MMLIFYLSVVLFIPFGVIVLALMISCCSRACWRLSHRLRMVSRGTKVTSASECLGLLKCSIQKIFRVDCHRCLCDAHPKVRSFCPMYWQSLGCLEYLLYCIR